MFHSIELGSRPVCSARHKHCATVKVMSDNISLTRNLVKGRIAETVFAQMFRDHGRYTVLEFGYEKVVPQLVGRNYDHNSPVIENLRVAPDFAVINQDSKEVRLIEVKFRQILDSSKVLNIARRMHKSWSPSYLFIATLDGFYFGEVSEIIKKNGEISKLDEIPVDEQSKYLQLLIGFENRQ